GEKYAGTRHNVGFAVADELARRVNAAFETAPSDALMARKRGRLRADGASAGQGDEDVLIVKPLTFMNLTGQAAAHLLRYFKIDAADLLGIVDEVQLPLGKLRARARGSAGGHNGLKSVIAHVGEDFSRLRLGVGRPPATDGETAQRRDLADHVLARFDR